jgi:hypothetical protein
MEAAILRAILYLKRPLSIAMFLAAKIPSMPTAWS